MFELKRTCLRMLNMQFQSATLQVQKEAIYGFLPCVYDCYLASPQCFLKTSKIWSKVSLSCNVSSIILSVSKKSFQRFYGHGAHSGDQFPIIISNLKDAPHVIRLQLTKLFLEVISMNATIVQLQVYGIFQFAINQNCQLG